MSDEDSYYTSEEEYNIQPNIYIINSEFPKKRKIQFSDEDDQKSLKQQINNSDFTEKQKLFLLDYLKEQSESEKRKNIKYIERILKLPTKTKNINSSKLSIPKFMEKLRLKLDKAIFGHNSTKEEVIDYITSIFSNKNAKAKVLALQSPPGCGKCLAYGTEVMMYDGTLKQVQDIEIGDKIMGDDSEKRKVLSLGSGMDFMYKITHSLSKKTYTVNSEHILCLVSEKDEFTTMNIKEYLGLGKTLMRKFYGYSLPVEFKEKKIKNPYLLAQDYRGEIHENILNNSLKVRVHYLSGLVKKYGTNYGSSITLNMDKQVQKLVDSLGFPNNMMNGIIVITDYNRYISFPENYKKTNMIFKENIFLEKLPMGMYYGFTIDGNSKFFLGNHIVTHNTKFVRALGEALDLPFQQISLGGISDSNILTGHDFTYVGSKPGKIYDAITKSKYLNGIIYLDECDKIGLMDSNKFVEVNGVLTHLLDKEQNNEFYDNYVGNMFPIDLSKTLFICSFNNEYNMDQVALNRMKVIKVDQSTPSEKIKIVKDFTIPELSKNLNIKGFEISDKVIKYIILHKCIHEPGLRNINKAFETLLGKINTLKHLEKASEEERKNITTGLVYENVEVKRNEKGLMIIDIELVDKLLKKEQKQYEMTMYN